MYKKALSLNLRYPYCGQCTTEDLFDLDLEALNEVYKLLRRQRGNVEDGLIEIPTNENKVLDLKLEVVKDIFQTKQAEIEERKARVERKAQKQRILEIIASKQDADLQDKSVEELTAMIEEL